MIRSCTFESRHIEHIVDTGWRYSVRALPSDAMRHIMILAAAVLLTACGGGGSGVDTSSASAIAKALDAGGFTCTGFTANKDVLMARTDGTCDHGSTTVSITTFNSREQRETVEKAFAALSSGVPVHGDAWSVSVDSASQARQVVRIIGGSVSK